MDYWWQQQYTLLLVAEIVFGSLGVKTAGDLYIWASRVVLWIAGSTMPPSECS